MSWKKPPERVGPIVPIEQAPPRLYHRTTQDAAFAILEDYMMPGFGDTGKAHCYFSPEPLEGRKVREIRAPRRLPD